MSARKKQRPAKATRKIQPQHSTRNAELAANAADRYFVDIEGPKDVDSHYVGGMMQYGIRDRKTGLFEPLPTYTRSEVDDRVEQLNGRAPLASSKTLGRLRNRKSVKWSNPELLSPTEWVERLYDNPRTRTKLQAYQATGRAPLVGEFVALMEWVAPTVPIDSGTLDKVSQQLRRKFGIKRPRDQKT